MRLVLTMILAGLTATVLAADSYRIVEVSQNATDWSATVSVNGAQAQAFTFPQGKRPTNAAIVAQATSQEAARKAAVAAEAAKIAVDPTEKWSVEKVVAGKSVTTVFPVGTRPTAEDMRKTVAATAAQEVER